MCSRVCVSAHAPHEAASPDVSSLGDKWLISDRGCPRSYKCQFSSWSSSMISTLLNFEQVSGHTHFCSSEGLGCNLDAWFFGVRGSCEYSACTLVSCKSLHIYAHKCSRAHERVYTRSQHMNVHLHVCVQSLSRKVVLVCLCVCSCLRLYFNIG